MNCITEPAYAKINLWLDVLGKRGDGYHNIKSVMHTVSLCDTVTVSKAEGELSMTCTDPTLSCGEDNLCMKAARRFFRAAEEREGARIHLEKVIPREAGLGGGSADAAAVLRAMNRLYGNPFSEKQLCSLGADLGADVPFCVMGGSYLAEGIGEILREYRRLPPCSIVISGGVGHSSTPEAYRKLDQTSAEKKADFSLFDAAMKEENLSNIAGRLYNRFEDVITGSLCVKELLLKNGAEGALMSGSGTSVFGLYADREKAENACGVLRQAGLTAFLCEPV